MKTFFYIFLLNLLHFSGISQPPSFNFRHLTTNDGLSDGTIHAMAQDKYGFIWIGTSYGLNRFDGINMKNFFSDHGGKGSLKDNLIQSLYCDTKGNLWIGTIKGLNRYDYIQNRFISYDAPKDVVITEIHEDKKGKVWLGTTDGLWLVNESNLSIQKFTRNNDPGFIKMFAGTIQQIVVSPGGEWYMATSRGIKIFDPILLTYSEIRHDSLNKFSISGDIIYSLALDTSGQLWAGCVTPKSILNKIDLQHHTIKFYDYFVNPEKKWGNNIIRNILVDKKGRLWITSSYTGLSLYNEKEDNFHDYQSDLMLPNSLINDNNAAIFQDNNGIIWLGTSGYGISYFSPDKNLFSAIHPSQDKKNSLPGIWCRAACEDRQGNLWLGTGNGLAKYDRKRQLFAVYSNEEGKKPVLHSNSIRSLLEDDHGNIWIGTAKGLNRYNSSTGKVDFFDEKQGVPLSFFWMMTKGQDGNVWIGSRDGLFHYISAENRFDNLSTDTLLSKYARHNIQAIFTDRKNRVWIGILNVGLVVYDAAIKKTKLLTINDSLISDTRFSSFAEDKNGIIWIGSEEGLVAYDPAKNSSRFFTRENGLPSNRTNNIMVDALNRVWVGTSNGLCVLNNSRKLIRRFDINDGLLTNQFNEQSAYCTHDDLFIFPTYKGFVVFRPENYKENYRTVPIYITSFKIAEKELLPTVNTEDLHEIQLRHDQNFFNIELAGLNYMNPLQCSYAYKLEPFDKDWIYTRKKEINYTNVPAGNYVFHYKVITDNPNWGVTEKTMQISIAAIFYRTWWFKSFVLLVLASGLFSFLRYRIKHREKILILQSKAQLLEKEKALVMYESLKQQLNPHFLFNSLTSLSSLIQKDQKVAKQFLDQMSKIYRYILKTRDSEMVPLSEEIKLVEVYTQLQQTRFQRGLQVNININEEEYHRKIVPVTLQNLVENAIKHNIIDLDTPLVIDIFIEDNYLIVCNNLQKKNFVETSNQQGLTSMQSLYHYLSSRPVIIKEDEKYFTIKIPLI